MTSKFEKVEQYKNLAQTIALEDRTTNEVQLRIQEGWIVIDKYKEITLFLTMQDLKGYVLDFGYYL